MSLALKLKQALFMPVSKMAKDAMLIISLVASQITPRYGKVIIVSSYLCKNF